LHVFVHHLADVVVFQLRDEGAGVSRGCSVLQLLPGFQLAARMVIDVPVAGREQRGGNCLNYDF